MQKAVALVGFSGRMWLSVNKTINFYINAISKYFPIVHLEGSSISTHQDSYSLIIVMCTPGQDWSWIKTIVTPVCIIVNGSLILDHIFLRSIFAELRSSDGIIVNCKSDLAILRRMFKYIKPRILLLPLPIDTEIFKPLEVESAKRQFGIKPEGIVLGFVGRLLPQKNLHQFLHMTAMLKSRLKNNNITALIHGKFWADYPVLPYITEQYYTKIIQLIKKLNLEDNVIYSSNILKDEMLAQLYNTLDVLIVPTHSIDENFGYVSIEAMSCGIPVVGTEYGGLKDSIIHKQTGFLMPSWVTVNGIRTDFASGVDFIENLLCHGDRNFYSHSARHHAATKYNYSNACKHLLRFINSIKHNNTTKKGIKIRLARPIISPRRVVHSSLPNTTPHWRKYYSLVSYYTHTKEIYIKNTTYLMLVAPLSKIGTNIYQLQDYAWPAAYQLNSKQLRIIKIFEGSKSIMVRELRQKHKVSLSTLRQLVNQGILNFANRIKI